MKTAAQILHDLVRIPTVSSLSNQPVIDYVRKHLKRPPWNVALYRYTDPGGVAKTNLVATAASQDVELALVCHTDTVPFDAAWDDALTGRIRNGRLYGRGSCDVKGFLACMLASIAQVDVKRLSKPMALVLTADEEVGCVGAKYLAGKQAIRARYTIIGEPTGLQPVRAGKGYALAEIVVHGVEAHSAFPEKSRSAIFDAAHVLLALEAIAEKLKSHTDPSFDPPYTTLNAGLIRGGTAKNIIPGECRITVEWRPIPGQDPQWVAELIRAILARLPVKADLEVKRLDPPFDPSPTQNLSALLESLTKRPSTTFAFVTEAAHLSPLTREVIVFGPGDMTTAHKTGEHVKVKDLEK